MPFSGNAACTGYTSQGGKARHNCKLLQCDVALERDVGNISCFRILYECREIWKG